MVSVLTLAGPGWMTGHRSSLEETDSVSNGRNGAQIGSKKTRQEVESKLLDLNNAIPVWTIESRRVT